MQVRHDLQSKIADLKKLKSSIIGIDNGNVLQQEAPGPQEQRENYDLSLKQLPSKRKRKNNVIITKSLFDRCKKQK